MSRRRIVLLTCLMTLLALLLIPSCNTLGMMGADPVTLSEIVGTWEYVKKNNAGLRVTLTENKRYTYEEIGTVGQTVFKESGRFELGKNSLHFIDLNRNEDPNFPSSRAEEVHISFVDDEGVRKLRMVVSVARWYDLERVNDDNPNSKTPSKEELKSYTKVTGESQEENTINVPQNLEGAWQNDEISIVISGDNVTILENGEAYSGRITSIEGNSATVDLPSGSFTALFVQMGANLTLVPADGTSPIVLKRIDINE